MHTGQSPPADRDAFFEALYREHYGQMTAYAAITLRNSGYHGDPDSAHDAVQETFSIALHKADDVMASPLPAGWLYTTLLNVLRNLIRREQRLALRLIQVENFDQTGQAHPAPGADLDLEGMVEPEELALLRRLYLDGVTYEELCQEMGLKKSALAMRVKRIKEKFQRSYLNSETDESNHTARKGGSKP